jgi:hypothetical protein
VVELGGREEELELVAPEIGGLEQRQATEGKFSTCWRHSPL